MSNLNVAITADVVDLNTKFAIAKAQVSGLTVEMNKLARASVNGGLDATASARLQQVSGSLISARGHAADLAEKMKGVHEASGGLGNALEEIRGKISGAFAFTGAGAAAEAIAKVAEGVKLLGDRAIEISSLSQVLNVSTNQLQAMQVASAEAGVAVDVLARASEKLTNYLSEARNGSAAAIEKLHALGVTTTEINEPTFQLNELLGVLRVRLMDVNSAEDTRKALLQDLGSRTALAIGAIKGYDSSLEGVARANARVNAMSPETIAGLKEQAIWWDELGTKIKNTLGEFSVWATKDMSGGAAYIKKPQAESSSSAPQKEGAAQEVAIALDSARQQEVLRNQLLQSEMNQIKVGVEAFEQGSAQRLASLQLFAQLSKQLNGDSNVDQVRKADQEVLAETRAFQAAQGRELIANARQQISMIGAAEQIGTLQRLEAERDVWQGKLAAARKGSTALKEITLELTRSEAAIIKEGAAETAAIDRQDVQASLSIGRLEFEAKKSAIDLAAAAEKSAVDQKLEALRTFTAQEFALNNAALEKELDSVKQSPVEYDRVYNEIRELKAKLVADLAKLDRDAAEAAKKEAKEQSSAWKSAIGEIENAEGTFVSDVLNKRKTMAQSLRAIGAQLVTQELTNDLRAFTTKVLLQNSEKALTQGGLLYHAGVEAAKAAETTSSQATQTAAVEAGAVARATAETGAAAVSKATGAAENGKTVLADAAKAFSGTYAAIAQIPYVGPYLAPAAAAAAYAAVAAMEGLASLDTGTMNIPADMRAQLHQGEAVIPRPFAESMRRGEGLGGGGDTHYHINALDADSFMQVINRPNNRAALAAAMNKHFTRGGR